MKSVVVTYVGAQTALGDLEETWQGLLYNRCGLEPLSEADSLAEFPVGRVPDLEGGLGSAERLNNLLDTVFTDLPELPETTGLVMATTKAGVDELLAKGQGPWPGQPWDLAETVTEKLGLKGDASTVSAACASGTLALISAAQRLLGGECKTALVVGVDLLSRFVISGFAKLHALDSDPCRPFDQDRHGLCLGEGVGVVVLADKDEAMAQGWPILARISGWGASCDAKHITAPCKEASGLIAAINQATANGRIKIGGINAHGTGTRFNDAMEMRAFQACWPEDPPPFHSVKGAIGHTLGAAGVIEAGIAVKSLADNELPPTVGFEEADQEGASAATHHITTLRHPAILSCNSGFGGVNGCLVLEKV